MNKITFTTISGKKFENLQFDEEQFFDYMKNCGVYGIEKENQVILFLNNVYENLIIQTPYDSVHSIVYDFSEDFCQKYNQINDLLKYDS